MISEDEQIVQHLETLDSLESLDDTDLQKARQAAITDWQNAVSNKEKVADRVVVVWKLLRQRDLPHTGLKDLYEQAVRGTPKTVAGRKGKIWREWGVGLIKHYNWHLVTNECLAHMEKLCKRWPAWHEAVTVLNQALLDRHFSGDQNEPAIGAKHKPADRCTPQSPVLPRDFANAFALDRRRCVELDAPQMSLLGLQMDVYGLLTPMGDHSRPTTEQYQLYKAMCHDSDTGSTKGRRLRDKTKKPDPSQHPDALKLSRRNPPRASGKVAQSRPLMEDEQMSDFAESDIPDLSEEGSQSAGTTAATTPQGSGPDLSPTVGTVDVPAALSCSAFDMRLIGAFLTAVEAGTPGNAYEDVLKDFQAVLLRLHRGCNALDPLHFSEVGLLARLTAGSLPESVCVVDSLLQLSDIHSAETYKGKLEATVSCDEQLDVLAVEEALCACYRPLFAPSRAFEDICPVGMLTYPQDVVPSMLVCQEGSCLWLRVMYGRIQLHVFECAGEHDVGYEAELDVSVMIPSDSRVYVLPLKEAKVAYGFFTISPLRIK